MSRKYILAYVILATILFWLREFLFVFPWLNKLKELALWLVVISFILQIWKFCRKEQKVLRDAGSKRPLLVDIFSSPLPIVIVCFLVLFGGCNVLFTPKLSEGQFAKKVGDWDLYEVFSGDQGALGGQGWDLVAEKTWIPGIIYRQRVICGWFTKYGPGEYSIVDTNSVKCINDDKTERIVDLN